MEGIVEENGTADPLAPSPDPQSPIVSVQSVIQPNQQSVIQTAANIQPMLGKGNVILVSKPNSVIQTTQGSLSGLQTLQVKVVDAASDDSFSEEESPKKRRDLLTRRPSYRKILNDLGGGEIAGMLFNCMSWEPLDVLEILTLLLVQFIFSNL
jgi:cAMP response element-binding protein